MIKLAEHTILTLKEVDPKAPEEEEELHEKYVKNLDLHEMAAYDLFKKPWKTSNKQIDEEKGQLNKITPISNEKNELEKTESKSQANKIRYKDKEQSEGLDESNAELV